VKSVDVQRSFLMVLNWSSGNVNMAIFLAKADFLVNNKCTVFPFISELICNKNLFINLCMYCMVCRIELYIEFLFALEFISH